MRTVDKILCVLCVSSVFSVLLLYADIFMASSAHLVNGFSAAGHRAGIAPLLARSLRANTIKCSLALL